jgi:hypothetical protein
VFFTKENIPTGKDGLNMTTTRLYYSSVAICGGSLGVMGLSSVSSGTVALVPVLLLIGGVGLFAGAIYEGFITSPSTETLPDDRVVWFTVAMAVIVVLGGIWSLVG